MLRPESKRFSPSSIRLLISLVAAFALLLSGQFATAQQTAEERSAVRIADAVTSAAVDQSTRDPETGLTHEVLNSEIDPTELELRLIPMTKAELELLAEKWLEIVREKTEEVMSGQIAIHRTEGAVEDAARDSLAELALERGLLFSKFSKVISALEKKGGDPALVSEYRAYRSSVIVEEKRTSDVKTLVAEALRWSTDRDGGVHIAIQFGVIVSSLIGLLLAAKIVRAFTRRWIDRVPNLSKLLQAFLVALIYWLVLAIGLMVVLSGLGIDISPVFALIGGASFIMAFAFQETLGNLASGLMIMINRPFDEGHYVDVGGVAGTVDSVSIVATTVVTPDNQVIVIPNKNVWGNVITNVTASRTRRVDLVFGISYEDSIADALRVIEQTTKAHPLVLDDPKPMIRVNELADSSVNFICRPWTNTPDYWDVYWDLTQQIKENFDAAGLSIPYPQQDLHIKRTSLKAPVESIESE
ncbi:mechanosensitive ion channel family protein [Sulfitobacter sp. SK012]|uniref:mechanosensitive ion channel family protein n=1 Tax=Sulfitobacter sp. SK012 TaxID=1389005 RepID=UPI000E0A1DA6|nr:mechanosensitive ion channel domain-containing protein [Sulfitobacter sp. SK012]AXI46637.1 mechanosensitive ion channel family protein [Sulfitobacter sp. SK012]